MSPSTPSNPTKSVNPRNRSETENTREKRERGREGGREGGILTVLLDNRQGHNIKEERRKRCGLDLTSALACLESSCKTRKRKAVSGFVGG
ncbi:hypothetical protein NC652_013725 [Populus alba x Populus x berolinensis]|nr:hypothetical protein NC652_013725 [Populus alba x Populus x berolinensis]